jgi:hypothetical protein
VPRRFFAAWNTGAARWPVSPASSWRCHSTLPGEHDVADAEQPIALMAPGLEDRGGGLAMLDALAILARQAS